MALQFTNSLVFAIHGMGEHEKDWEKPFINVIDESIREHKYSAILKELKDRKLGSVTGLIDFKPIAYSDVFSDLLEAWADNAADAIAQSKSLPERSKIERATNWLEKEGNPNDSFVWTHLLDVFLWVTSSYVRMRVKSMVGKKLTSTYAARRTADKTRRTRISIVSHSLGTSVAMQTLHDLFAGAWGEGATDWTSKDFRIDSYHTVANVSDLLNLAGDYSPYDGMVRPGPPGDPGSCILYFNNYRHDLDPFTLVRAFNPPNWSLDLFDSIPVRHIRDVNVHALEHYALHPSVHIRMLRSWFGYDCVSWEEEVRAQKHFPDQTNAEGKVLAKKVDTIAGLAERNLGVSPDLLDILKSVATVIGAQGGGK